jgi:hypothetical protein
MNLDSVRALKMSLAADITTAVPAPVTIFAAAGANRRPVAAAAPIALGVAPAKGKDFKLAIRIQKDTARAQKQVERITLEAKGEVDVRFVGKIRKCATPWYQQTQRPLRIGCSVGHVNITAGTLGCFVKPRGGNGLLILSNNHVLADENRASRGDAIIQPGDADGGSSPGDKVATLQKFVRMKSGVPNFVDGAVAKVLAGVGYDPLRLQGASKLAGKGASFLDAGAKVAKLGRTTGFTRGRVTAFELDNVVVGYDTDNYRFDNQIEIEGAGAKAFSAGGDSGSLIFDEDLLGVALLFAGGDEGGSNGKGLTYANPLDVVLDALGIDLLLA